jgi:uncharacterized phage infection (PIP) family protein YhgE
MQNIPLPLVSNLIRIPPPQALGNNDDNVSEAYEYAKNICKLKETGQGLVSNTDQSEALVYYHKLVTSMSGNVQPVWFFPIQQQLQQIQQGQQQLQQGQQQILQMVTNVETRSECRRYNRRLGMNDVLLQMPDSNGNIPQNFPQTFSDVNKLNNADASALLQAYGLIPERLLKDKRSQIIDYLK